MEKIAPHIRNKRGSMLMFTLIVFMVILILGMTMITSMLYSQGENNMQINKQKAYYAAFSAVEAVKAYFLDPKLDTSTSSLRQLVGGSYYYELADLGIQEDTSVTVEIIDSGKHPTEPLKKYIDIKATAECNGEQSIVTARMIEQEIPGSSGGLFGEKVALGCGILHRNPYTPLLVEGNIFISDEYVDISGQSALHAIHFAKPTEGQDTNNLYLKATKSSVSMNSNVLNDAYIQVAEGINMDKNEGNNLYIQTLKGEGWVTTNLTNNNITNYMRLFAGKRYSTLSNNVVGGNFILDVNIDNLGYNGNIMKISTNAAYISGVKEMNAGYITAPSTKPLDVLYTNARINGSIDASHHIKDIQGISESELAYIDSEEQKVGNKISNMEIISKIFQDKTYWPAPEGNPDFKKSEKGFGDYPQNQTNSLLTEYVNEDDEILLVFSDVAHYFEIKTKNVSYNKYQDNAYVIPPEYEDYQIFIILQNAIGVDFHTISNDGFDALYVYSPTATCQFAQSFSYIKGSIIAKQININGVGESITFRVPENIDGLEIPGGEGSTGGSSGTTYTYHFEEYIESDND